MVPVQPEVETHHDVVVLRPLGDIDLQTAQSLHEAALANVANTSIGLVLDLSRVAYVDSAGVRVMFAISNRLDAHRQRLVLVVPDGALVRKTLAIVDIDSRAVVHASVEAALAHLRE